MRSPDAVLSVLLAWKTKGTLLSIQRPGSFQPMGELDAARIVSLGEEWLTLQFSDFDKSFTFLEADLIEKVPHLERKSFTRAVRLSGGDESIILLEGSAE
jgi:hypothetical protein